MAMNFKHIYDICKKAVVAWVDDYAPSMGAAISYYTVFSLAPLLIIVIAIAGAVFGRDAVQGQIVAQLGGLIGEEGATAVQGLIKSASDPGKGLVAGIISSVVLAIGATTVFGELQSALDRIWHVPEKEKPQGIWGMIRARFLSFGLVLGLGFLMMVSLVVSAGVAAFGSWSSALAPGWEVLLQILNIAVSLATTTVLFAMIYKLMPSVKIAWRDVWVGAAITAVLFEVGKLLIGLYIGKSGVTESFAAAGSLVVLLAWVYYAAQIFLLGAEFTKVIAFDHAKAATKGEDPAEKTDLTNVPDPKAVGSDRANGLPQAVDTAGKPKSAEKTLEKADIYLDRQTDRVLNRFVALVVVSVAELAVGHWYKKQKRKEHELVRKQKRWTTRPWWRRS